MEAVALYDFNATISDELTVYKGETVYILSIAAEEGWLQAVKGPLRGIIPDEYVKRKPHPWLSSCQTRQQAHDLLLQKHWSAQGEQFIHPEGTFLVRGSTKEQDSLCISIKKADSVVHYKIHRDETNNSFYVWNTAKFESINTMVEHYLDADVTRDKSHPVFLKKPQSVYEAMFEFEAKASGEVDLKKGDIIFNVQIETEDGWAVGEVSEKEGLFPFNYAKEIFSGSWETQ